MSKKKPPVTAAIRQLRKHSIDFIEYLFDYREKGGTEQAALALGIDEHVIIKTLIMEDDQKKPLIILMHGDNQVSTKRLARTLGVKSVTPCDPQKANKYSGYEIGGTSPFGTRQNMPVFVEASILELSSLYINGGKRGYLLRIGPHDLSRVLNPTPVNVSLKR